VTHGRGRRPLTNEDIDEMLVGVRTVEEAWEEQQ